jgi:preprotein translocase subunit SecY
MITVITTLVAGSVVMMWLGELINEKGIGNGTSMILLAGIVSQAPSSIASLFTLADTTNFSSLLVIALLFLAVIGLVVFYE